MKQGAWLAIAPADGGVISQVSLVHPAIMFGLLGVSIYTGILGWNYRQARLIPVMCAEHCCTVGWCCCFVTPADCTTLQELQALIKRRSIVTCRQR